MFYGIDNIPWNILVYSHIHTWIMYMVELYFPYIVH